MPDSQRALSSASFQVTARALAQYLTRVGRRVLWFKLVRGAAFSAAAAALLLLLCASLVGPSLSPLGAVLTWATVLLGATLALAVGIGSLENLSGPRRAKLLRAHHPALAARVRSAAELTATPNGSPELIASLAGSVADEIARIPLSLVIPAPRHFRTAALLALLLALGSGLLIGTRDDALSGLYAMLHPGARNDQGALVGLWVSSLRARIAYPAAVGREPEQVQSVRKLSVPEGAMVELTLVPRFGVPRAVLKLGDRMLPLARHDDGTFTLSLSAEESGRLELRARVGDAWVTDPEPREISVEGDAAPVVELLAPMADQDAQLDQRVPFIYRVRDDHGLDGVDLVVQLGPNRERRIRLASFAAERAQQTAEGSTDVVPAAFGARPGQTIAVWIEARDRDSSGGANVGRSPVRTLRVGEQDSAKGPEIELLVKARDSALDALADRLELRLGGGESGRVRKLARSTQALVSALSALAGSYGPGEASTNEGLVRDMMRRLSRLVREESSTNDHDKLTRVDRSAQAELEEDALWLTDLLGRAKLDAAEGALSRLAATRERMRKLLKQLKESDDPTRRAELLAEIARARAELRDIGERLSDAESEVPSDFVNYDALKREAGDDPLEQLEDALAKGDMEAAERALGALDERMASLQNGLQGGDQAFRSARFSPREAALERAKSELSELQRAQEQLAKESDRVAERARGRSEQARGTEANNARLAQQSEALEKRTRDLEAGRMQPGVGEQQRTAAQRLRDARDALKQGQAQEARNMAERAVSDLEALATEMQLDARMFPGRDGSRMGAAREAEALQRDVEKFARDIEANAPRASEQLSNDERDALKKQAPPQQKLGERAGKLADSTREEGPSSLPSGLERATQNMRQAEGALERGELDKAREQQREALDRLRETAQELEQQQRASRGKSGRGEGNGQTPGERDEKVTIPGGGDDTRRSELRRRVLDARRATTPDRYEGSVERYYQEILR